MKHTIYPQLIYDLDYGSWLDLNECELNCIFAETGADREMDFDREVEEQKLYTLYERK